MRVTVIGAGVVGLSAAVRLREAGLNAHIVASELPTETTSAVAAAMWYPYRAFPAESVTRWSARSSGYVDGWRFPSPIVDTSRYLPWLAARLVSIDTFGP